MKVGIATKNKIRFTLLQNIKNVGAKPTNSALWVLLYRE